VVVLIVVVLGKGLSDSADQRSVRESRSAFDLRCAVLRGKVAYRTVTPTTPTRVDYKTDPPRQYARRALETLANWAQENMKRSCRARQTLMLRE